MGGGATSSKHAQNPRPRGEGGSHSIFLRVCGPCTLAGFLWKLLWICQDFPITSSSQASLLPSSGSLATCPSFDHAPLLFKVLLWLPSALRAIAEHVGQHTDLTGQGWASPCLHCPPLLLPASVLGRSGRRGFLEKPQSSPRQPLFLSHDPRFCYFPVSDHAACFFVFPPEGLLYPR